MSDPVPELFRIPSASVAPEGFNLLGFQEEDLYRLLKTFLLRKGIYNGNPMGAGKTIETLACLRWMQEQNWGSYLRFLILGPAAAIGVWEAALEDGWLPEHKIQVLRHADQLPHGTSNIVLCSFDLAIPVKTKYGKRDIIARELLRQHFDVMVVDEAHHLSSADSLRSRLILGGLYPKMRKTFFLSGSISRNRIPQLWPVFRTIAPDVIPSYWHFVNRYCQVITQDVVSKKTGKPITTKSGHQIKEKVIVGAKSAAKAKELGELALNTFLVRRPKSQVLSFLPKKLEQKVYIDCPLLDLDRAKEAADDFRDDIEEAMEGGEEPRGEASTAYQQLGLKKAGPAFSWIHALLEEIEPDESVVVFCYHREVAIMIGTAFGALNELGISWGTGGVILGGLAQNKRDKLIRAFQAGEMRLLISTYAGAEAVTLTRANYLIRVERAWSRDLNEQAEDRVHRIGQEKTTYIKDLLVKGTMDEIVYNALKRKMREHKRMFG